MNDKTPAEIIQNLTPEEITALNKQLTRRLAKTIAIRVGATVAVAAVLNLVTKRLDLDTDTVVDAITE